MEGEGDNINWNFSFFRNLNDRELEVLYFLF
jgi:hypothetical protein